MYICFGFGRANVVGKNRAAVAWGLSEPYIPGNDCLKHQTSVKRSKIRGYCRREICTLVVHGQQQSFNLQCRIHGSAYLSERIEKVRNSFQRVVLTLHWND